MAARACSSISPTSHPCRSAIAEFDKAMTVAKRP
jgi:hypothetical protein